MMSRVKKGIVAGLVATLAISLASISSLFLLEPAPATAAADDEEVAKKAEWQDRYRALRNNAVRMRDNAIKLRRAYSLSQHSNYPRGGARERFTLAATAAGQAILEAAGGAVLDPQGRPFRYNQRDTLLNGDFIAFGDLGLRERLPA